MNRAVRYVFWLLLLFILASSCTQGRKKKLYSTFIIGKDQRQYVFKPLRLESDSNETALVDIAFRDTDPEVDSADIKIAFISKDGLKFIDSLQFGAEPDELIREVKFKFAEKQKGQMIYHYSCKVPITVMKKLFSSNKWKFIVYRVNGERIFVPATKTKRGIKRLNKFVMLEIK